MKIIKKINKLSSVLILAAAFGASSVAQAAHVQPSETEVELDNTAAVVNNSIITENELNAMTDNILATYRSHGANVDELTARKQAIQTLITRSIILQMARQSGMDITDMQLDATLEQTALRTNSSVDKILSVYGPVPKAVAREKFKEDFIINDVRRSSVRQRIHISEAEVTSMS
ncbi:MAG: SurA N-terminal domain-containing protein, partial [Succinivibrio sp.]